MAAKPDLLAEFRELAKPRRLRCSFVQAFEKLDQHDRATLTAALAADWVRHTDVTHWLAKRGIKLGAHTVQRHRNRECSCEQP